jgi:sugar O-acyltransferase (sialic acid O-acetyltransferase NeuD family)
MSNKKLIIVGAGEFAEIADEYFTYDSEYTVCGYAVNSEYIKSDKLNGKPVTALEQIETVYPPNEFDVFVAVPASDLNQTRTRLYNEIKNKGYNLATYISSAAFVWRNAKVGDNCFIFENNTIQPFVEIGNNVVLWSGNHIGHRTKIEDNVFVSSHVVISGYCNIGSGCFLGVNSTFNDNTSIAPDSILASGSLVNRKLAEEDKVYIGSPAKALPRKSAKSIKL